MIFEKFKIPGNFTTVENVYQKSAILGKKVEHRVCVTDTIKNRYEGADQKDERSWYAQVRFLSGRLLV